MSHVKPERWGDMFAGRVGDAERAQMQAHANDCKACKRTRDRVGRASDSFTAIREQAAPELPWDGVRARVHWSVSKERREEEAAKKSPPRRRMFAWGALALVASAGVAAGVYTLMPGDEDTVESPIATAPTPPVPAPHEPRVAPAVPAPTPLAGLVSRIAGHTSDVLVDGVRPKDLFSQKLVAGTVIATGNGRIDVQFGDASAFALGPRSTLELRRFDSEMIELRVEGTLDVEVAPRAANQRFIVVAGVHTVEVRGTQFQVRRDDAKTTVACRHGLVAVRDDAAQALVGAARQIAIAAGEPVSEDRVVPLSVDELAQLADAAPLRVPAWTDVETLLPSSAPLEIATVGRREVRVDGIELGAGPMIVRVMPGRHTVEATDHAGRYRRAGWIDVAAPKASAKPARLEVAVEPAPNTNGVADRRRQLKAGIDRSKLSRCTRSIAKAGLTDTFVQVEIAVDASGAIGFLNVIDTDLPTATAACVREVLAEVAFGKGPAATWRERIDL
jgi:ferric-dicitrate binding protein FerR (iron transport regulator)